MCGTCTNSLHSESFDLSSYLKSRSSSGYSIAGGGNRSYSIGNAQTGFRGWSSLRTSCGGGQSSACRRWPSHKKLNYCRHRGLKNRQSSKSSRCS